MVELDRPRLLVDFNEMVEEDVVLLSREDTRRDSSGNLVELRVGLRVYLYTEDADDSGAPCHLLATGIVELNDADDWSSSVRWRCRIDQWES
jgi:hypothetical protein